MAADLTTSTWRLTVHRTVPGTGRRGMQRCAPLWGQMRRRVSGCVLLALLAAFSAAPSAAGTIVGQFYFQPGVCDYSVDPDCDPTFQFEYFVLANNAVGRLGGLTFSALIQLGGSDYDNQFIDSAPIASGESAMTLGLFPTSPFGAGGKASLIFSIETVSLYPGKLSLSNLLYDDLIVDDGYSPSFSAAVEYSESGPVAVTDAPSWLVVVLGVGALAVGRVFLA